MDFAKILGFKNEQVLSLKTIIEDSRGLLNATDVISTGSNNLDDLLGGGFHSSKIYLIYGANKTGKTQLCHQACVQAYKSYIDNNLDEDMELDALIYYIDTENTFRPERLREIAKYQDIDEDAILQRVKVAKITSNNGLLVKLREIEQLLEKESTIILIIDSLNNFYRLELGNPDLTYTTVKSTFIKVLRKINELTHRHNLISLLTCQVSPIFSDSSSLITESPVGHLFLNHFFSEFIYLKEGEKDDNYAHLTNSSFLPEQRLKFKITSKGIEDV